MRLKSNLKDKLNPEQLVKDSKSFVLNNENVIKHNNQIYFFEGENQVYLFYFKNEDSFSLFYRDKKDTKKTGLKLFKDRFSFELPYLEKGDDEHVGDKLLNLSCEKESFHQLLAQMNLDNLSDEEFTKIYKELRNTQEKQEKIWRAKDMHAMTHNYCSMVSDLNSLFNHPILELNDLFEQNKSFAKQASSQASQMLLELNFLSETSLKNGVIGEKKKVIFNDLDNSFYIDKSSLNLIFTSQNADFVAIQENEKNWKIYATGMYDVYDKPKELMKDLAQNQNNYLFNLQTLACQIKEGELIYLNGWSDYMTNCLSYSVQKAESEFDEKLDFPIDLTSVNYQLASLYEFSSHGLWKDKASIYSYLFGVLGNGYYVTKEGNLTSSDTKYNVKLAKNMDNIVANIPTGKIESLSMIYDNVLDGFSQKISPEWKNCLIEFCDMLEEFKTLNNYNEHATEKDVNNFLKKAKQIIQPSPKVKLK